MKLIQKHNNLNRQIAGLITLVILITFAFVCIVNTCFLGDFYLFGLKRDMVSSFNVLNQQIKQNTDSSELDVYLQSFSDRNNVSVMVIRENGEIVAYFGEDRETLLADSQSTINSLTDDFKSTTKSYEILKTSFNNPNETYVVLIGRLLNENTIFMSSSLNTIDNFARKSNIFLLLMFFCAIIIAGFLTFYFVKKLTRPLFDLIDITKRITNFDFAAKYRAQRIYNELDDLGEHINEMSTTLERAINQLTRANENLKKDLELQEETENMRKEFISNVSHELKTPIALIQGYAEGLQEGIMDDENSRQIYLDVILDEANKMNRLVREMLILNQLEAGQMAADLDDFNVTDILDGIIDSNRIYFEAQNVKFSFINKEDVIVRADEFLVEQVFTNFLSNAIHYVMNENIINVKYEFNKKGKVRISVFNTGNNISKKDAKQIWDKFYKVDKARSREYGGSGIGLSVVKAVMELLHEKFGLENLPDGVEFWFELSLAKDTKNKQNT